VHDVLDRDLLLVFHHCLELEWPTPRIFYIVKDDGGSEGSPSFVLVSFSTKPVDEWKNRLLSNSALSF